MKRFYKLVSLGEGKEGFTILLDGKPVKTPSRAFLQTGSRDLANAIVQEWVGQGDKILPATMPLTQILNTRIDRVSRDRAPMTAAVMKYLDTDLLCYRAAHPPEMAKRQAGAWNPWLDWFEGEFKVPLATTDGLKALTQPARAHGAVQEFLDGLDDDHFTIAQIVASLCGSVVLALAFVKGAIAPAQAFDATHVEEYYKAELYNEAMHGPDPSQEKKDRAMRLDLEAAAKFLDLL